MNALCQVLRDPIWAKKDRVFVGIWVPLCAIFVWVTRVTPWGQAIRQAMQHPVPIFSTDALIGGAGTLTVIGLVAAPAFYLLGMGRVQSAEKQSPLIAMLLLMTAMVIDISGLFWFVA